MRARLADPIGLRPDEMPPSWRRWSPHEKPGPLVHPVAAARRATRRRIEGHDEAGFTLIELIITITILPIVVGAISVAVLSGFNLQGSASSRLSDSNDELVSASVFNKDVQSAQEIETATTPACGTSGQTQIVGLEWGLDADGSYQTVVSYVTSQDGTKTLLIRQICSAPPSPPSATPTSSRTVAHDAGTPTLTLNPTGFLGANTTWQSTQGLYGVTINITAPSCSTQGCNNYPYSLSGLPSSSTSTGQASQIQAAQNPAGCNLASPGSGTYAPILCFADFSSFTNATSPTCPGGVGQQMKLSISDSPDVLQFCVSASPKNVTAHSIPTYYNPGANGYNSEAYLGNNGFYTGIAGEPSLYQLPNNGAYTVVTFSNIEVINAVGEPATGWELVTGDAESTDSGEWIEFQNSDVVDPPELQHLPLGQLLLRQPRHPRRQPAVNWTGLDPPHRPRSGSAQPGHRRPRTCPRSPPLPGRATPPAPRPSSVRPTCR